ncbi:hypothetical protein [Curtobacterium sp. DN_7.5]|uniref:hypothetical protein n=1 Tax=Curtobacterium sp. DN_7.5 TaxID=3049047 RepID=UPI001F58F3D6|nr:hypothetical protein [Curtobacterium sp. DN_7.5]
MTQHEARATGITGWLIRHRERADQRLQATLRLRAATLSLRQTLDHPYRHRDAVIAWAEARAALRRADFLLDVRTRRR